MATRRKWTIRSYNVALREIKKQHGISHRKAQATYRVVRDSLKHPVFGVDVKRHSRIVSQAIRSKTVKSTPDRVPRISRIAPIPEKVKPSLLETRMVELGLTPKQASKFSSLFPVFEHRPASARSTATLLAEVISEIEHPFLKGTFQVPFRLKQEVWSLADWFEEQGIVVTLKQLWHMIYSTV